MDLGKNIDCAKKKVLFWRFLRAFSTQNLDIFTQTLLNEELNSSFIHVHHVRVRILRQSTILFCRLQLPSIVEVFSPNTL